MPPVPASRRRRARANAPLASPHDVDPDATESRAEAPDPTARDLELLRREQRGADEARV